ncbi:MAG: PLP-dependent transferase [Candidatus Heimdallarchaeota archaeon]|nr:PLP-dependent transferase [Candidatus Heimdallarchaeota archaeon]
MDKDKKYGLSTIPIHGGTEGKDSQHHPVNVPIYMSSTFAFPTMDHGARIFSGEDPHGFTYTRLGNPTTVDVETRLAQLEGGEDAALFGSGMAAVNTLFTAFLKAGDHIIADHTLYGGTHSSLTHMLPSMGIEVDMVDASVASNIEEKIKPNTKMIYFETPTNPTMRVVGIKPIVDLGKKHNILTAVDSTFMSPINQRPIEMGVDIVLHSVTKYLNGHSDIIGGVLISTQELMATIKMQRVHLGGNMSPFDSYLLGRGLKTLKIRMKQVEENGRIVADFLRDHPMVKNLKYLGHEEHPDHELAKSQQSGFGGMMAFEVKGDIEMTKKFVDGLELIIRAVSLGGVDSLVSSPALTTHSDLVVSPEDRKKAGIPDTLVRLSVGIEDAEDLISDLKQAFDLIMETKEITAD